MAAAAAWALAPAVLPEGSRLEAQESTGTVTGRVQNAGTGNFLHNARVRLLETGAETLTDSFGYYRFANVPAGEVTVEGFYTGLDARQVKVTVQAGATATRDIRLTTESYELTEEQLETLETFEVAGGYLEADAIALNEQRFSANLKNVVSADAFGDVTEGNVGEFIKYLPGVSVDYVAADVRTISVRGFSSDFTGVTADGNRMASAASSGSTRSFELEQVSMNNVARLEVTKSPTPSMGADTLGGTVNMISKSAFELEKPEFKYRAYLSMNNEDLSLDKSPGPGHEETYKIRPGFDFTYSTPIRENLGISVNALVSDQFNEQHRSQMRWEHNPASNPYLRRYTMQDGPKETLRWSLGTNVDWRASKNTTIKYGLQYNSYDAFFGNRNINYDTGSITDPTMWSPTFTHGRASQGAVTHATSWRNKYGATLHTNLNFDHQGEGWRMDGGIYYSNADNHYRDTENGHFSNIGTRDIRASSRRLTVSYDNMEQWQPGNITLKNKDGTDFDPYNLSNFEIQNARSQQHNSEDIFQGGQFNLAKDLNLGELPLTVQGGVAYRKQKRDIYRPENRWNFVGADRVAGTADDNAALILDDGYFGEDHLYSFVKPIQFPSPEKLYQLFLEHEEYFFFDAAFSNPNNAQNDYYVEEEVTSYYLQGDLKFWEDRMALLGGVRYEKTDVYGLGYLRDIDTNTYIARGASSARDYDGFYPSAHLVYNIRPDLIARFSYAATLGRPNFDQILPGTRLDDDPLEPKATVNNTGLKPWEADNYDIALEYYFGKANMISVGWFQKNVSDFFGTIVREITDQDLVDYTLPPEYLGGTLTTKTNAGEAKISGVEVNYVQQLTFLPQWARGIGIFGNGTFLDLEGNNESDFSNFIETSGNWGLNYDRKPVKMQLKWNYRGEQRLARQTFTPATPDARQWYGERLYLDANLEVRVSKHMSVFINGRNILNEEQDRYVYSPTVTPEHAYYEQNEEFGVQYAIGVKGSF